MFIIKYFPRSFTLAQGFAWRRPKMLVRELAKKAKIFGLENKLKGQ
jgi:hypothetical protein